MNSSNCLTANRPIRNYRTTPLTVGSRLPIACLLLLLTLTTMASGQIAYALRDSSISQSEGPWSPRLL